MERPFPAYKGADPYIFVSYAHENAALVYPEITHLKEQGFNIWYDEGISPGATWRDEVAAALTQCRVFLLLLTPSSAKSSNCMKEINFALSRERKILAIHLEPTELPVGLELSLSDMQAILKADHSPEHYADKVQQALTSMLPAPLEPVALPQSTNAGSQELDIHPEDTPENSIAILPLVNRNLGEELDYLGDGISEELISGLSKVPGLKVASQMASFRFKGQDMDPKELGNLLGVHSILAGSLQRGGSRVRVNVILSQADDGTTLWSQRYEGDLDDIFAFQDDVAHNVVETLSIELAANDTRSLIDAGTENPQAYDAYLLGKYERAKQTQVSHLHSLDHFKRATELDPSFARAYRDYAWGGSMAISFFGLPPEDYGLPAENAYQKAIDNGLEAQQPLVEFRRALYPELRPNPCELALEACDKIENPDPRWFSYEYMQIGTSLTAFGLFNGAIRFMERYRELVNYQPGADEYYDNLHFWTYQAMGNFDKAIDVVTSLMELRPDLSILVGERALSFSRTGQYGKAEKDLEFITRIWSRNFAQFYHLFWRREIDSAKAYYNWLDKRKNLPLNYKVWGSLLLNDMDKGVDYLDTLMSHSSKEVKLSLHRILPQSTLKDLYRHSHFQQLMEKYSMDEASGEKVLRRVNELAHITGIEVRHDEEY